ncbi:hypothetical protein [Terribacillus saccharophilus]|uniref:hypothetical protein n=1 Tax=Terribacillus saccharophilus TaxID=361277 RepID=UPI002DCC822B|nr:hypothetical protein [Terribacillus saccharophilus]MEC0290809.1 hypothetical protein [Terribacillus saccharophilus]
MRKILLAIISLGVLYFIVGFIAVRFNWFNWFSSDTYNTYATIVGGVATLCGLLTFAIPKLTPQDIEMLEIKSLEKITKIAEDINVKRSELNLKESELSRLEKQKKEMEILVIKASTSLFLQDQIKRSEARILSIINKNKELMRLLNEVRGNKEKLAALDEEIQDSEEVELLEEIIQETKKNNADRILVINAFGIIPLKIPLRTLINFVNGLLFGKKR